MILTDLAFTHGTISIEQLVHQDALVVETQHCLFLFRHVMVGRAESLLSLSLFLSP